MAEAVERFRTKEIGEATVQQARDFLEDLAQPVLRGDPKRRVLATNLLEEGKAGPSSRETRTVVNTIKSSEGWLFVPDDTWKEAISLYLTDLGCTLESAGAETWAAEREGNLRNETKISLPGKGAAILRVEEYDPKTRKITLLGIEIARDFERINLD